MSATNNSNSATCSRRWTKAEAERLEWLYVHGGDKAHIPMCVIAEELGRTEAACRSKLHRIFNANVQSEPRHE